jgi:hypothetical protein
MKFSNTFFFALLLSLFACNSSNSIKEIKSHPEKFRKPKTATVEGVITSSQSILGYTIAKLRDEDGDTIWVVTQHGAHSGDHVTINGHYAPLAKFSLLDVSGIIED